MSMLPINIASHKRGTGPVKSKRAGYVVKNILTPEDLELLDEPRQ